MPAVLLLAVFSAPAQGALPPSQPRPVVAVSWRRSPDSDGYEPRSRRLARTSGLVLLAGFAVFRLIRSRRM